MNINTLFWGLAIAFGFGGWPIIASRAQTNGAITALAISAMAGSTALVLGFTQKSFSAVPTMKQLGILLVAGVINGLAFLAYSSRLNNPQFPVAQFVTTVSVCIVLEAPIIAWVVRNEIPSPRQWLGFAVAALAIYLLRP